MSTNTNGHQVPAHTITIPDDVRSVAVETWADGLEWFGIIWDRTGHEPEDGEWGAQLVEWHGDRADVVTRLEGAGFTVGEFVEHELGDGPELLAVASRDGA